MSDYNTNPYYYGGRAVTESATNTMLRKVYLWMCFALAITGLTAYYVATTPSAMSFVFGNSRTLIALIVVELGLVIGLTAAIARLSAIGATLMFILYSVINGMTMASIFVLYEIGSIATTFFVTAGTFGVMAIIGSITKIDLTKIGGLCIMAVIGLIIATIVNVFVKSSVLELVVSCIGVVVFVGLTAYDAQKIKALLYNADEDDASSKIAVLGALSLYLDFINLFLYLLRIFGRRSN